MKKISKAITNKRFFRKIDNLYSKDTISLNNSKNKKYLDNMVYQKYLKKLQNGSSDFDE